MKQSLDKDARSFVAGVVGYLRRDKKGTAAAPRVEKLLRSLSAKARSEGTAQVETAVTLTAQERGDIARALGKLLGHTVTLACRVNAAIIGGMRVTVGDWVVDMTWERQLDEMASQIV